MLWFWGLTVTGAIKHIWILSILNLAIKINVTSLLGHIGLKNLLNWDELLHSGLNAERNTLSELLISCVLTLFLMENVRILVEVLSNIVVAGLDENLVSGELETDLLIVCL